jgi:hypothetical protein
MLDQKGTAMRIIRDLGLVRVISLQHDPRIHGADILVQIRETQDSDWVVACKFNSFTSDSAYTNATEAAFDSVRELARKKANAFA